MFRKEYIHKTIIALYTIIIVPIYAINKIHVSGTVEHVEGGILVDAQLTLERQNISATTNRFGEFDLGKVFPNDTLLVKLDGFQHRILTLDSEINLIKSLLDFPNIIQRALSSLEPQTIANYLHDIASMFHKYYSKERVVIENSDKTAARLVLVQALQIVLSNGLDILGIQAPERM